LAPTRTTARASRCRSTTRATSSLRRGADGGPPLCPSEWRRAVTSESASNTGWRVAWPFVLLCVAALALALGLLRASTGPDVPVISDVRLPSDPTDVRSATFMYTDADSAAFTCSLDGSSFVGCGHGIFGSITYDALRVGAHLFQVRAVTGDGTSRPDSFSWTV